MLNYCRNEIEATHRGGEGPLCDDMTPDLRFTGRERESSARILNKMKIIK